MNFKRAYMKAKEISNLYWFCQSVEYGGFTPASLVAQVSAPTLSRAVSQLEQTLGEKLLHRNAKQFKLTAAGEKYYQQFAPLLQQLDGHWDQLSNHQTQLTGDISISCPESFADSFLQQAAIEFMTHHPNVNIQIELSSDTDNFFNDQIDLAISTNPPKIPHLVQRRLFDMQLSLAASPAYIAQHTPLTTIEQLTEHDLLAGNTLPHWEFKQNAQPIRIQVKPKYAIDSLRLIIKAACSDVGICLIPKMILEPLVERNQLIQLLPDIQCPTGIVYIVWADRKLVSARVSAFRQMIIERMSNPWVFLSSLSEPS
jgi:DNA-binding transcriptional LysR family regulator